MKIVMLGSVAFAEKMGEIKKQLVLLGHEVYLSEIISGLSLPLYSLLSSLNPTLVTNSLIKS